MTTGCSELKKVIGIGFHKTGTKTLGECLRSLGYRHQSLSRHHFNLWLAGQTETILADMEEADSFEDWPWPLLFRQVSMRFTDARFILTTRRSPEQWFESLASHVRRQEGRGFPFRKYIYGCDNPDDDRQHHINVYQSHNTTVRRFFADQPHRLLEVCWDNGDGWEQLCDFLGHPQPGRPFPHCNAAPATDHHAALKLC
jgi:hypothetical protein